MQLGSCANGDARQEAGTAISAGEPVQAVTAQLGRTARDQEPDRQLKDPSTIASDCGRGTLSSARRGRTLPIADALCMRRCLRFVEPAIVGRETTKQLRDGGVIYGHWDLDAELLRFARRSRIATQPGPICKGAWLRVIPGLKPSCFSGQRSVKLVTPRAPASWGLGPTMVRMTKLMSGASFAERHSGIYFIPVRQSSCPLRRRRWFLPSWRGAMTR